MLPSRQASQLTVANVQCAHTDTTILTLYHYMEPLNLVIYIRDFLQSVISQKIVHEVIHYVINTMETASLSRAACPPT